MGSKAQHLHTQQKSQLSSSRNSAIRTQEPSRTVLGHDSKSMTSTLLSVVFIHFTCSSGVASINSLVCCISSACHLAACFFSCSSGALLSPSVMLSRALALFQLLGNVSTVPLLFNQTSSCNYVRQGQVGRGGFQLQPCTVSCALNFNEHPCRSHAQGINICLRHLYKC